MLSAVALALLMPGSAHAVLTESLSSISLCDEVVYEAPSGSGNDITFSFDTDYECGQFANGDWFVVPATPTGSVTITGIEPAMDTGRHGVVVNPSVTSGNAQSWDSRIGVNGYSAPTMTFNYAAEADESIVKYVSRNAGSGSCGSPGTCGQFAAVLTVLAEAPAEPSETFRPPYFGTYKPLFSTDDLQEENLLRLSSDCCASKIDAAEAVARTSHQRLDHSPSSTGAAGELEPYDAFPGGLGWGGDVLKSDTEVVNWLLLDDACDSPPCDYEADLAAKTPVLIGYVQYGIDLWGATRAGTSLLRGGGGNGAGKLFTEVFAAAMLDNEEMQDDIAGTGPRDFWETFSLYRGEGDRALWGQMHRNDNFAQWQTEYWDELGVCTNCSARDPYSKIDGGAFPGLSYQRNTMMPTKYAALILRLMPALHDFWPGTHESVVTDYADRVVTVGAWTNTDDCAPKSGSYGVHYGPDGSGGCIGGSGRADGAHGLTKDGLDASRHSDFGNEMWDAFRIRLLAPETGTTIGVDEPFAVEQYGQGHVRVEFATDLAFTDVVCDTDWFEDGPGPVEWTYPGPIGASGVSCPLEPGTYYWRATWGWSDVSPDGDDAEESLPRTFSVNTECNTDDTSGCVPGAVLELDEQQFSCSGSLEEIAEGEDGVLPLLVRVTFDEPVMLSPVVDLKAGCEGDGNAPVTLSDDCDTDPETCYDGTGYVPGDVDLILEIEGDGATYGGRDTAVKVRQSARDIVVTGQVDCGPRGAGPNNIYSRTTGSSDDPRQEPVTVQGGERITLVDVQSGDWATQTSTCMAADGAFDADEVNSSFPVEDVVCIGCRMVTCARGLTVGETLRSGAIDSFFRNGDPQWKLVDLPATVSDNGVDAGQCYHDGVAKSITVEAVDPIDVGNFFDRYPYSPGGD